MYSARGWVARRDASGVDRVSCLTMVQADSHLIVPPVVHIRTKDPTMIRPVCSHLLVLLVISLSTLVAVPAQLSAFQAADSLRHRIGALEPLSLAAMRGMNPHNDFADMCPASLDDGELKTLFGFLDAMSAQQRDLEDLTGSIRGGGTIDEADGSDQTLVDRSKITIKAEADLEYGGYENKVELGADISVDLSAGGTDGAAARIRENISTLHLAYDRYWAPWAESFVFIDRLSDDFLSIDERYELGGGMKWVVYRADQVTSDVEKRLRAITNRPGPNDAPVDVTGGLFNSVRLTPHPLLQKSSDWIKCLEAILKASGKSGADLIAAMKEVTDDLESLEEEREIAAESLRESHATFEFSVLTGAFMDIDQRTLKVRNERLFGALSDSARARLTALGTDGPDVATMPGEATSFALPILRDFWWEVRPTVRIRPHKDVEIRADHYMKFLFGSDDGAGFEDDTRTDTRVRLKWDIDDFTISARYRLLREARVPLADRDAVTQLLPMVPGDFIASDFELLGNDQHHIFSLTFGLKF